MTAEAPWKDIARRKQAERQSRIPPAWRLPALPPASVLDVRDVPRTCGLLSPRELEITENYDATSLAEAIRAGAVTAEQVARAFCKRAAVAQQVCNCLTEIFFDDALARAAALDRHLRRTGMPVGPLHGVPISLKDTFKVRGYDASIGLASLAFHPARANSALVDLLLDQGAVLYCKTNVPQTLMALDSDNNLFGRVLNPRNRAVTAGGSSGGEGALLAMRASPLGVGTDVGGSIRIPAMCNGLFGLKPSRDRVPYAGQENGARDAASKVALPASAGPLAASARDCELFLRAVAAARPWERDPSVVYGAWEEQGALQAAASAAASGQGPGNGKGNGQEIGPRGPLLGFIRTDGLITPLPPVAAVLDETVQALRRAGVEVVEVAAPAFKRCQSLANAFFGVDGANFMFDLLEASGEPLTAWLSTRLRRKEPVALDKLVGLHAAKAALETEMLGIWKSADGRTVDAIVCPVAPHPVPPIDRWNGVSYTSSFVLLDYPAATVPIRDFEAADLDGQMDGEVLGSWDKANRGLWDEKTIDRKVYLNTTLSVQVIAPRLQERRLYQAMALIDGIVHKTASERPKL